MTKYFECKSECLLQYYNIIKPLYKAEIYFVLYIINRTLMLLTRKAIDVSC
jgi:hypothetical protein